MQRVSPSLPSYRCDLLDQSSAWLLVSHDFHGFPRHGDQAVEIDVHLCFYLIVCQFFKGSAEAISCIVDHDVHTSEFVEGGFESGVDVFVFGHVEFNG